MFRILHIAFLTAVIVACPLRCMAGSCQTSGAKNTCGCCRCEQPADERDDAPGKHEDNRGPSKCRCACLCKGATIAERQFADVDAIDVAHAIDVLVVELLAANSPSSYTAIADPASIDLKLSGRSLRFLLTSLQI